MLTPPAKGTHNFLSSKNKLIHAVQLCHTVLTGMCDWAKLPQVIVGRMYFIEIGLA